MDGYLPLATRTAIGRATPAGNAVAILDLLDLAERTGKAAHRERAAAALRAFAHALDDYPAAVPALGRALLRFHGTAAEKSSGGSGLRARNRPVGWDPCVYSSTRKTS